ncbi:hypothetical protein BOX15_Mlig005701g4, partial [Macrostomum lignano]
AYSDWLIGVSAGLCAVGFASLTWLMPRCRQLFLDAGLSGRDMAKKDGRVIPEAQGVLAGAVYLCLLFAFIPLPFADAMLNNPVDFPHADFVLFITALLCVCCMLFLGFADDALNLRWLVKLVLPCVASLPLLMVYYVNRGWTRVVVPLPLRPLLGVESCELGPLYYAYMGMLAVFCTNAINIYAGVNGLESGQSLLIAGSLVVFNALEAGGEFAYWHRLSLHLLLPYVGVCAALYRFNRYPAQVFVGDTFCYFSGMLFAVAGILGHYSKTLLLFQLPQVANFALSMPQLFRLVPCPRHRLPRFDPAKDQLQPSTVEFCPARLSLLGRLCYLVASRILAPLRLVACKVELHDGEERASMTNLTLINAALVLFGPMHEAKLTRLLLALQIACTALAFAVRYPVARLFYGA